MLFNFTSLLVFISLAVALSDHFQVHPQGNGSRTLLQQQLVKWGNTFDVSLVSKNVKRTCKLPDGRKICCIALEQQRQNDDQFSKPVGSNYSPSETSKQFSGNCQVHKQYFSSPQEIRDYAKAVEISKLSQDHTDPVRVKALVDYVISDEMVKNSSLWLERVKFHMSTAQVSNKIDPIDFEFLSRFEFTRTCDGVVVDKWIEWIEPLTITARHPFAFGRCRLATPHFKQNTPRTGRSNVDYVLLQSGHGLYKQKHETERKTGRVVKHYMFDAGTSTFDSSLFWFTCGYSQRKVGFDQIFGWEMTLLEPTDYWKRVPAKWKPFWHFYNIPITVDSGSPDSPQTYIQQIATAEDFVAFKLDIDSPGTEMPLALSLLSDDSFAGLVDEFFFELHFRCEVMTSCGWGKKVPAESHGLKLDRPEILEFFTKLRERGIRAHIWP